MTTMKNNTIATTATSGSVAEMTTTEKHDSRQTTEGNNKVSIMFGMFFFLKWNKMRRLTLFCYIKIYLEHF